MVSIGAELREAREKLGLSPDQVSEITKIRKKYITAMEDDDFGLLPGGAYVKGFIRNYARVLELDEEALMARFEAQYQNRDVVKPAAVTRAKTNWRPMAIVGVLVVILGVVVYWVGTWANNSQGDLATGSKEPGILNEHQGTNGDRQGQEAVTQAQNEDDDQDQIDKQQNMHVQLQVDTKVCWMRILVDNESAFEGNVEPGITKTFKGNDSVFVLLGDAGAVKVTVNGKDYGYLGELGEVVEKTFVSTDAPADG